jgi:hypothetical protein
MVEINLIGGNIERWETDRLARSFMKGMEDVVDDYRSELSGMNPPEDKTTLGLARGKRWYEVLPPRIEDAEYVRRKRDRIRFALSVFKAMEEKGLIPEGEGHFDEEEIRKIRRNFIESIPHEDSRPERERSDFVANTRQMMIFVINRENPLELRKKLQEVEARLEKLTVWGLEGLSI